LLTNVFRAKALENYLKEKKKRRVFKLRAEAAVRRGAVKLK